MKSKIDSRYLVTRVENTIPLREHWSMPFVFAQFLIVGYYLDYYKRRKTNSREVTMQTLRCILSAYYDAIYLLYVYVKYYMVVLLMI